MTKKELLENEVFMAAPEDAEIVFATGEKLKMCVAMNPLNISLVKECVNEDTLKDLPLDVREHFIPEYKTALVIDAIPYWYLKEKYGVALEVYEQK